MKIEDIMIILSPNTRAQSYIQKLVKNDLLPNYAILMVESEFVNLLNGFIPDKIIAFFQYLFNYHRILKREEVDFNVLEPLLYTLTKNNIRYDKVYTKDCNNKGIIKLLKKRKEKFVVFTGGGILKKEILNLKKKFIHVHSGKIPSYRGSTCFYYSIINEGKCAATAFFIDENLDTGDVIKEKEFSMPKVKDIDYIYDPYIRSEVLVDVIKDYVKSHKFISKKQDPNIGETYFIIHPVLKHLAILKARKHTKS